MSRWFELKYKSNYIILAAETCRNFYFQKQNYKLLSLNNKHVGAKLNRDQTIIKTIQKTIEIASGKIEKTIKRDTVHAAQKQKKKARGLLATFSWARGPTANGRAAESARRGVHSPARLGRLPTQKARRSRGR